jgi:small subunit ribosomal protein S9
MFLNKGVWSFARRAGSATVRSQSTIAVTTASTTTSDGGIIEESKVEIIEPPKVDQAHNRQFRGIMFQPQMKLYNDPLVSRFVPELERRRIVPSMPTFYSRNPYHESNMSQLQDILNKNATLPFDRRSSTASWLKFKQYKEKAGGELLKETEYLQLITILKRLDSIDVELRPDELNEILAQYSKKQTNNNAGRDLKTLDNKGRAVAIGRRKSSSAKIYVVEGSGEILVNGKSIETVFPKVQDRLKLLYPLQIVESESKFNIFGLSRGGGSTGQVEALQLALARALCIHNPLYKQRLSSAGVLHRDPRSVERKKPGKKKARKMPTWVKR